MTRRRPVRPNPFYRRNADEAARRLERAAATGDPDAAVALIALRLRTGQIDALPLEQKIALRRAVVDALLEENLEVLELEELGDGPRRRLGVDQHGNGRAGWFPLHESNVVCPRGHSNGGQGWFEITDGTGYQQPAHLDERGAFLDLDQDDMTDMTAVIICVRCRAAWPLSGPEGVTWVEE